MPISKKIVLIILGILCFTAVSCKDDNTVDRGEFTSCDDGIQNGGEEGVDCGGPCPVICPTGSTIGGEIVGVLDLTEGEEFLLTGPMLVRDGAQLIIRSGVTIKAQRGTNAYIAIAQGGTISVFGTENNPVVLTSNEENPQPGDWGGLLLFGKAPTNSGGIDRSDLLDIFYGGTEAGDSSGILRYLRIEYAGAEYDETLNFNGLSLYGVGSFTTIRNVETYRSQGNGFKFIGGTVNSENLIALENEESGIVVSDGWNGVSNSWYISNSGKNSLEILNSEEDPLRVPITGGEISDVSLLAPSSLVAIDFADGGGEINLSNIYTSGIDLGIQIQGNEATTLVNNGEFIIDTIEFDNTGNGFMPTNYAGPVNFFQEGDNLGAGNKAIPPDWAALWTIGF